MTGINASVKEEDLPINTMEWITKAVTPGSIWENKDDLLDAVYWGRHIVSIFIGCIMGFCHYTGCMAILLYILLCAKFCQVYLKRIQKVDPEELGGLWAVNQEGFKEAFAAFMVSWIACYTAHF